ncbi:hypothetical protein ACFXPR_08960 [Nocardia tengchongensis]|uniref:hypothetical protein n=1 Tax=Nocardia tengchongensis TaxID=2055889 RepID=UPI0036C729D7
MAGFAVAATSCALVAPGASADITGTTWTPGVGGDPNAYTLSAAVSNPNSQVYFYDYQLADNRGNVSSYVLVGGGPQTVSGGTAKVNFYPTTTGQHFINVVERSATGEYIQQGGGAPIDVPALPKTSGPAPCEPTGGSLSNGEFSISSRVLHPNTTYTLTYTLGADDSAFAGYDVYFEESAGFQGPVVGKTTFTNGVATIQYTPKNIGEFDLDVHTNSPDGRLLGHKQFRIEVSSAPTGPSGCTTTGGGTGSADGIPVIGGLLKALGL